MAFFVMRILSYTAKGPAIGKTLFKNSQSVPSWAAANKPHFGCDSAAKSFSPRYKYKNTSRVRVTARRQHSGIICAQHSAVNASRTGDLLRAMQKFDAGSEQRCGEQAAFRL